MNLYRINISSSANGAEDLTVPGVAEFRDGAIVFKYEIDGDKCALCVKDGKVVQSRKGAQCVDVTFAQNERTVCTIANCGFSGSFEVYTRSVKFISGKYGYKLYLDYVTNGENINLVFTALKNKLEKK